MFDEVCVVKVLYEPAANRKTVQYDFCLIGVIFQKISHICRKNVIDELGFVLQLRPNLQGT